MGKPGDAAFQRQVLDAAFALLKEPEGPVLVDFPETIQDATDQPLSCTLPPRSDASQPAPVAEAIGLRKAYDRALERNGRTNVGRLADADGMPGLVQSFVDIAGDVPWKETGIPNNNVLEATKDIMSYYEEAASALVDHTPAARAAESWFFQDTETGKLLGDAQAKLREAGNPIWFYVKPLTQRS